MFQDWRKKDISCISINFSKSHIYLMACRAVGIKGWLGAKHTYISFYSFTKECWLLAEVTDHETLQIQSAKITYQQTVNFLEMRPFISDRPSSQRWFGANPKILDSLPLQLNLSDFVSFADNYPFQNYNLFLSNCNTFVSYINYNLHIRYGISFCTPLYIGFKNTSWWSHFFENKTKQKDLEQCYEF